jgi:pimeloyl-ACP methyl ester carboxylesterase
MLLGDADAALGHLGSATVLGRGLGAYIALLLSGARAAQVAGAVLVDGPGINGGGSGPTGAALARPATDQAGAPDPFALLELARDVRPPDYAMTFVHLALSGSPAADPITVAAMAARLASPCAGPAWSRPTRSGARGPGRHALLR